MRGSKHAKKKRPVQVAPEPSPVVLCVLVCGLVLVAFAPVGDGGFVSYDTPKYVTENDQVRQGLTAATLRWALTTTHFNSWHPLTWCSHALDVTLFGLEPLGHHLHSLVLHGLASCLFLLFLLRLTGSPAAAAFGAAVFAVHPLRVESVAWVAARKDVLCGAFWSAALYCHGRAGRTTTVVTLFGLAAMASKATAVTLPLVLLMLDRYRNRPESMVARLRELAPLLVAACAVAVVAHRAQQAGGALAPLASLSLHLRVGAALVAVSGYLEKTVWPTGLACHYPHPATSLSAGSVAAALGVLVMITFFAVVGRRRFPAGSLGWAWFAATVAPVCGLIPLGTQAGADRFTYLPAMGLSVAIAGAATAWAPVVARHRLAALALVVVVPLVVVTRRQTATWHDGVTLYRHALAVREDDGTIENNLGVELMRTGHAAEAEGCFVRAVERRPDFAEALTNLGEVRIALGRTAEGVDACEAALRANPRWAPAWYRLGVAAADGGRWTEAEEFFRRAVEVRPSFAEAWNGLGLALRAQGRHDEAIDAFRRALECEPRLSEAAFNMALVAHGAGRLAEAVGWYDRAIAARSDWVEAHANRGAALEGVGRPDEAEHAYRRALAVDPSNETVAANLAALQARRAR